ncbi:protein kinase [Streptomyces albus]|uniref:protein kinase n=1 Tax=Streptomyces albus TaxID=1888 RepID=UPI00055F3DFC|nr:protein kinase [Streptomyces albus]
MEEYAGYTGRLLAGRYRLPLPPADAYEPAESLAWDTASEQEVLVRQVPLPEVVDAEVVDDGHEGHGGVDGRDEDRWDGQDGGRWGGSGPWGGAESPGGHGADRGPAGPYDGRPTRRPTDPVVRRAMTAAVAAAQLPDHPRLDQVFDVFVEDDALWVVSERVPAARPLAALLAEQPLSAHRAAEIAADLLAALRIVHAHGWVHRNLTARTVLICEDGRALLTGLAVGAAEEALCGYDPLPEDPPEDGGEAVAAGAADAGEPDGSGSGEPFGSGAGGAGSVPQAGSDASTTRARAALAAARDEDGALNGGHEPPQSARETYGPGPRPATWTGHRLPEGFAARDDEPAARRDGYAGASADLPHPAGTSGSRRGIFGFEGIEPGGTDAPGAPGASEGRGGPGGARGPVPPPRGTERHPGSGQGADAPEEPVARTPRRGAIAAYRAGAQRAVADARDAARRTRDGQPGGPADGRQPDTDWWAAPRAEANGPGREERRPYHALDDDVCWLPSDEDEVRPDALPGGEVRQLARDEIYGPRAAGPYGAAPTHGRRHDDGDSAPDPAAPGARPGAERGDGPTALPGARSAESRSAPARWAAGDEAGPGLDRPGGARRHLRGLPTTSPYEGESPAEAPTGTAPGEAAPGANGARTGGAYGAGAHPGGRHGSAPAMGEPHGVAPYGDPHGAGPGGASYGRASRGAAPSEGDPHRSDPHGGAPRGAGPRGAAPYSGDPHATGPREGAPHGAGPHGGASYSGGVPHHSAASHGPGPHKSAPHTSAPHSGAPYDRGPLGPAGAGEPGGEWTGGAPGAEGVPGGEGAGEWYGEPGEGVGVESDRAWDGPDRYRGPATALAAERARHTRMTLVGPVTERWAPEQAGPVYENWRLAPPVGPAADLWALGVLLFRAVQGHAPYPEDSVSELVQMVCAEPPAYAEDCGPLRPVVESLMRQDPTDRPDFEELRGWLRSLVRSAPEPDVGLRTVVAPSLEAGAPADPKRLPIVRRRGELVRKRRRGSRAGARPAAHAGREHRRPPEHVRVPADVEATQPQEPVREVRREDRRAGGGSGPRRLGVLVLALILLGMVAAVAFVAWFLPNGTGGENARKGSVVVPGTREEAAPGDRETGEKRDAADKRAEKPADPKEGKEGDGRKGGDGDGRKKTGSGSPAADPPGSPKAPKGYKISRDPAGFRIAVPKEWDRRFANGRGQVRYNGGEVEMVVVNGRDATGRFGKDPMAYQSEKEPELAAYRASDWASTGGLRRIDVGDTAMAEGTFSWREGGGRQVYARNRAMILDGRYHVLLVLGSQSRKAEIDRHFEAVADTYRVTRSR